MFMQLKDALGIKPKPFPNGVPILYGGIERTDARLITMDQLAVDIDD